MMQRSSENQEKHFEASATAEEGGINSESFKKPFFTRNVIIATVGVIVALLVGVMIFVHVTSKAVEVNELSDNSTKTKSDEEGKNFFATDQSSEAAPQVTSTSGVLAGLMPYNGTDSIYVSNEEGPSSNILIPQVEGASSIEFGLIPDNLTDSIHVVPNNGINSIATSGQSNEVTSQVTKIGVADETNDENSLTSANGLGPDRIFFIAQRQDENGVVVDEIQSILANKTELLSHGQFQVGLIGVLSASNQEAQLIAYNTDFEDQMRIVIQNWDSYSKKSLDFNGFSPSFNAAADQIVFSNINGEKVDKFLIVSRSGEILKEVKLAEEFGRAAFPLFSHDEKSLLFFSSDENEISAIYKININEDSKIEKICDIKSPNPRYLVSPISDKIFTVNKEHFYSSKSQFVIVDFNDMNNIQSFRYTAETKENEIFDLLSWSSDGECVYMHKKIIGGSESIVKLDLESGKISEIYKIPYLSFDELLFGNTN